MADDEDRSKLFDEIRNFSQRKLKKVETKVVTGSGEQLTEKRSPKGVQQIKSDGITSTGYVVDSKPDLQVGMIIPGLFIASQDVAQDKSLLETYEITHILNLAPGVPNAFEDEYNYKKIEILDLPETDILQYFDDCIEFIQEGVQRGNCLVHCNAGVSRSTTICCAYLMKQKKMKYKEALATVREARAFAKPNDGFAKQLEQYDDKLFGQMAAPDSSEDKFMARKRAEIEAEKAAISGQSSVKNKLKSFGPQLESVYAQKLQSFTPVKLPLKKKPQPQPQPQLPQQPSATPIKKGGRRKSSLSNVSAPPPPPPPPTNLLDSNKKSTTTTTSTAAAPPPPPPPPINLLDKNNNFIGKKPTATPAPPPPPPPPPPPGAAAAAAPKSSIFPNDVNADRNRKSTSKSTGTKKVDKIFNHQQNAELVDEPPKRTAKSDYVDETPIKVAAQKKLWDQQIGQKQPQEALYKDPVVKTAAKVQQPEPVKTQATNKKSNKLGTWQKCTPEPVMPAKPVVNDVATPPVVASPEPKRKITIKKKDVNNNLVNNTNTNNNNSNSESIVRRATRDLAAAIEPVSESNSQSSTPYSSPGPQRRQMQYGRRTSTQPIGEQQQQSAPRKPMWGLRDQVDSLTDMTPTSTPTRCRSPALVNTMTRDSHSPSPQPQPSANQNSKTNNNKLVFGRVPPRKTSLSGSGQPSTNNNNNNELPVVSAPVSTTTSNPSTIKTTSNANSNKLMKNIQTTETTKNSKTSNNIDNKNNDKVKQQPTLEKVAKTTSTTAKQSQSSKDEAKAKVEQPAEEPPPKTGDEIRAGFKKVPLSETKENKSKNSAIEARRKSKGLNRSTTAEILKLIKTKSRAEFGKSMETVDEDIEIEYLLNQLDEAGLDNIDWDEIGLDENEVKDIVEKNADDETSSTSEESDSGSSSSEDDDDSDDEMEHTVFKPITSTSLPISDQVRGQTVNNLAQPKITSTATLTLKSALKPAPVQAPAQVKSSQVDDSDEDEDEDDESEEETETESD